METRYNPFNPQIPAKPQYFVGRREEIIRFNSYLHQTIKGSPMNMAIVGNRGIGKTSLLTKYEQMARDNECLVIKLSNFKGNIKDIKGLADFILQNLRREIMVEKAQSLSKSILDFFANYNIDLSVFDVGFGISRKDEILISQFKEKLCKIWEKLKDEYKAIVFLFDEAESIETLKGCSSFMFLREVFQRLGQEECHYMIVLCGKLSFTHSMAEAFSPLNRYFPATELKGFSLNEIKEYTEKHLTEVGVSVTDDVIKKINEETEGHPYMVVTFCYATFNQLPESHTKISLDVYKKASPVIRESLKNDFFFSLYTPLPSKSKNILINVVNKLGRRRFTYKEIVDIIGIKGSQVSPYIQRLIEKGSLNYLRRGEYEIFHKLYMDFVKEISKKHKEY